jgi:hypothetical protein
MNTRPSAYPLQIEGTLAPRLSRGLWLVKWLTSSPEPLRVAVIPAVVAG